MFIELFVVLLPVLIFLSTSQKIGWEECPQNDLFCAKWDFKSWHS